MRPPEKESVQSVVVLHFLKVSPTSLGLLFLGTLVVVLVEHVGADVHPVTHDFLGDVFRQVVCDTSPANIVWRDVHRTLAVTVVVRPLAGIRVAPTGTLNAVVAGTRDLVDGFSDIRAREATVATREQRLSTAVVAGFGPVVFDVALYDATDVPVQGDNTLAFLPVLQRRPRLGPVAKCQRLALTVVVLQVERVKRTEANPRVPQQFDDSVAPSRVLVLAKVFQDGLGLFGREYALGLFVFLRQRRHDDFLV